jgi:hypothetical protein
MKSFAKYCLPLLATALLAGCGGGGSDGHSATTPANSGRIELAAQTLTLPINPTASTPVPGGPFTSEVDITLRHRDGSLITDVDTVNVSVNPVSVATFSTLDDPSTTDINEIQQRWGQAPVKVVAGKATVFVTSYTSAGSATLTVTAPDAGTLSIQSANLVFTVSGSGSTPASIVLTGDSTSAYLASSGGSSHVALTAAVYNAGHEVIADTSANNVQFEVLGDSGNGSLTSGSASGQTVKAKTVHGVANATYIAGTTQGPITIKATADGADNNVDNGIDDPVSATYNVVVSDGQLYSLEITSPVFASKLPGITINSLPVSDDTQPASGSSIPTNPDATLSLTVSALATDRQGNPVLPGTAIRFGSVDEPVAPYDELGGGNYFQISGLDGNPKEGGNLFTAPAGHFTTAGGGAGPGDALIVFGKAIEGNANLESAVTLTSINGPTSVNVTPNFNLNATTGSSVDYGNALPYLIGRSSHGNITASAPTNDLGVASVKLTYTVNTVGHAVAVWAQGSGADRVTDALTMTYPGVAPAELTAFPSPIPGDTTTNVTVCLTDHIGIPLHGFPIDFAFHLSSGTGSVDGVSNSGTLSHYTGSDGCAVATVKTSNLPAAGDGGNSGTLSFSSAGATADVEILVQVSFLSASKASVCAAAPDGADVNVTAYSDSSNAIGGVAIGASCTNGATVDPGSSTTSTSGSATFHLVGPDAGDGTCTFTASGARSTQVFVRGTGDGLSPPCSAP